MMPQLLYLKQPCEPVKLTRFPSDRVKFSKKNQSDYLKYSPEKVEEMLSDMYVDAV